MLYLLYMMKVTTSTRRATFSLVSVLKLVCAYYVVMTSFSFSSLRGAKTGCSQMKMYRRTSVAIVHP